jgi:hypothetical protein
MVAWILVATSLTSVAAAAVYAYVGYRLYQRPVSPAVLLARAQFSLFWWGLGVSALFIGLEAVLAFAGDLSLAIAATINLIGVLVDCLFLWAIVDVLVFLYTGRYHLYTVTGLYALFYGAALYYTVLTSPYAVVIRAGVPTLLLVPVMNHLLELIVVVGLVFPEFIAAFLYLSLVRRAQDRTQRFRIVVVSLAIVAWFAVTFFYPISTTSETFERAFLQLVPAIATLVAYLPPQWMRTRLRITGINSPAPR